MVKLVPARVNAKAVPEVGLVGQREDKTLGDKGLARAVGFLQVVGIMPFWQTNRIGVPLLLGV